MIDDPFSLDEIRPLLHQHMVLLTAAGMPPAHALAVAAQTAVIVHDDELVLEALDHARSALQAPAAPDDAEAALPGSTSISARRPGRQ